jgi:hypothetical protein
MPAVRDFFFGPWRAVTVLGVTEILAWGALFYPPVLMMPLIAADRGWSLAFAMSGFSLGLLVTGLVSPRVGAAIDRYGGHAVMTAGSLIGALGLVLLVYLAHPVLYFVVWMLLGIAMAGNLYDPAFATLGRIFGAAARRPITMLTLAGGFASTVSWPLTQTLITTIGWKGAYLVHAGLLAFVCAPLHAFALPRGRAHEKPIVEGGSPPPAAFLPARGTTFLLVASGFAIYAFIPSGLAAHMLAIFGRQGIDASALIIIGALFGPSQVAARLCEFIFAGNLHPLIMLRFAIGLLLAAFVLLALLGFSAPTAAAFAVMFGAANGLFTIARGAVPLALFGHVGYGQLMGRIARPFLLMQAVAPLVLAFVVERFSDPAALGLAASFAIVALGCFLLIKRPTT